jgi:FkbM family methyltransferase
MNIDPFPGGMSAFQLNRPRDINLEIAVGRAQHPVTYYQFADSALNTFDAATAERVEKSHQSTLVSKKELTVHTLGSIIERYLPPNTAVTVLDIDVEGSELEILQGNDWQHLRPLVILVEYLSQESIERLLESELVEYLSSKGYQLQARTVNTVFFKRSD